MKRDEKGKLIVSKPNLALSPTPFHHDINQRVLLGTHLIMQTFPLLALLGVLALIT